MSNLKLSGGDKEELTAFVAMRSDFALAREKLCEIGVELPVGDEVAETFKIVVGVSGSGFREAKTFCTTMNAKESLRLRLEEVAEVFGEDHGDTGEVPQRGNDTSGFKLREEACREPGVTCKLCETH